MKKYVIILCITVSLLFLLEIISFLLLQKNDDLKGLKYTQVDPLLGWAISENDSAKQGFEIKHNCILLQNEKTSCDSSLVIYISGGSTSDLLYDANNWPSILFEKLSNDSVCIKIYIAAVGGYNSGQEYLKLLRDYDDIKPDIHFAYNGANEVEYPSYVSQYELGLFKKHIVNFPNVFLPNLFKLLQQLGIVHYDKQIMVQNKMFDSHNFWLKNNLLMNAHANTYGYKFISVLQPVKGFSGQLNTNIKKNKNKAFSHLIEYYEEFYPKAIKSCSKHDFIFDFTETFEGVSDEVFKDDCHLEKKYQEVIAKSVIIKTL